MAKPSDTGASPKVAQRKASRFLVRGAALFFAMVPIIAVVVATQSAMRSYLVEARTWGGTLKFVGGANHWMLEEALICKALETPQAWPDAFRDNDVVAEAIGVGAPQIAERGRVEDVCPASLFEEPKQIHQETVSWLPGARVQFVEKRDGSLVVRALSDVGDDLPVGSLIVVPSEIWAEHGALTFSAVVRIGEGMGPNAQGYLVEGHWEARETGPITSLFRDITQVVKSGDLGRGASVRIIDLDENLPQPKGGEPGEVVSFGHLTPLPDGDEGMGIVVLTDRGLLALEVQHFGLASPAVFTPDWMDSVSSSPVLIALAVLLTLLLTVVELAVAGWKAIWGLEES